MFFTLIPTSSKSSLATVSSRLSPRLDEAASTLNRPLGKRVLWASKEFVFLSIGHHYGGAEDGR